MDVFPPRTIDEKGRCCGRKPIIYKRPYHRLFCGRCDAEYDAATGEQRPNWAWLQAEGGFVPKYPTHDYVKRVPLPHQGEPDG